MSEELKERKEALFMAHKNGYDRMESAEMAQLEAYCGKYSDFLQRGKTERLCVRRAAELAEAAGFKSYTRGQKLSAGDKIYQVNRGKNITLAIVGQEPINAGACISAAHLDAPRLDLKPTPLYEDNGLAYFKTHYYGGIRKYQWVTIPLMLMGVIAMKDGSVTDVVLGEGNEPKYVITDLLPHLGAEQSKKALSEAIPAENLNILLGSRPVPGDDTNRVKLAVMEKLHEKYGITEDDFISAELEVVPAWDVTDIGLDGSMIGAYGHDDRVCAYAALQAILDIEKPRRTAVCVLVDKEEIGSMGVTGMQSAAFDTFMADLCDSLGGDTMTCYENSFCLSADVTAAFDPNYPEVFDKKNAAFINQGVALCKYTGARGKSGASDANAETVAYVRRVLDEADVVWQMTELGKADVGGGGTVAQFMANRNIATLDAGVPVLSMHAPFETVAKLDCYMNYKACCALYMA